MSILRPIGETGTAPKTVVSDIVVSGGAVSTVTTGAISLTSGKIYRFEGQVKAAVADVVRLLFNGLTTMADYRSGAMLSTNVHSDSSLAYGALVPIGESIIFSGFIQQFNGKIFVSQKVISMSATGRLLNSCHWHVSASTVTSVQLYSSSATFDNTSRLKIWEA